MRKDIVNSLIAIGCMSITASLQSEGRPEVSICQPSECENVEDLLLQRTSTSREHVARLSHEDNIVMKYFDLLTLELDNVYRKGKSLKAEEMQAIFNAIDFSADKHRLQTRKNKEKTPYISHPLGVAYNLIHYGEVKSSAVIIGALLHDTVEDTQTSFDEIESKFGKEVAFYVREMTDDKTLTSDQRKRLQVIDASKKSKGAAQINLADKLYNVVDLLDHPPEGWSKTRIERYYQWVQSVIDRLPEANDKLKKEIQKVINTYWEAQKLNNTNTQK